MSLKKLIRRSLFLFLIIHIMGCSDSYLKKDSLANKKILLRSSWQTINIGDIAHTPGVLALCEKYLPNTEVVLWASNVGNGVEEMLKKRFPNLQIISSSDTLALNAAFQDCDFLLHGSGPYLVADKDVERWIKETGKPFGIYGITLPEESLNNRIIEILNRSKFVFFRDTVSLELAKSNGVNAPIMEFGPDGAFACDVRNDSLAIKYLQESDLQEGKFLCVIPKYRRTPKWTVPNSNYPYDKEIDAHNQAMKEHDLKPFRDAITAVVRQTDMKILICPEDVTQMALGKEMLYDLLPEDVKANVVLREKFWLTDEALSVYVRSAGYFGVEQHTPIMYIGNGLPALLGRFEEQTSKGYMWYNIGLGDWFFDLDTPEQMKNLTPTVLDLANESVRMTEKALNAKLFVEKTQSRTMQILKNNLVD
ncbi:hypothetical protein LCGC14_1015540 [marine sediment metagenome]|uniref:Polysaccharide pyruvyl transferase family protein n=2 Tax=root TaxID=1 RepID=A0A831QRT6_9FLAO|nr:polysaccharide pyruvyl transferase family protein [Pricia antarctica]